MTTWLCSVYLPLRGSRLEEWPHRAVSILETKEKSREGRVRPDSERAWSLLLTGHWPKPKSAEQQVRSSREGQKCLSLSPHVIPCMSAVRTLCNHSLVPPSPDGSKLCE